MVKYPPTAAEVQRELQFYLQENKNLQPLLLFYKKLYARQRSFSKQPAVDIVPQALTESLRKKEPLLSKVVLPIPLSETVKQAEAILTAAHKELLAGTEHQFDELLMLLQSTLTAQNLEDIFCQPGNLSLPMIQAYLRKNPAAAQLTEQHLAVMAQVIRAALQMYFVNFARQKAASFSFENWKEGICPVCGEKPMLAMLRAEDGSRVLECGLCHTQWDVQRIFCTSCGTTDQQHLSFFYIPEQTHRRVYVCHQCKGYLKTIVLKELAREIIPDLENLVTYYLDQLAAREGYGEAGKQAVLN